VLSGLERRAPGTHRSAVTDLNYDQTVADIGRKASRLE
jgi:hypothetical protein